MAERLSVVRKVQVPRSPHPEAPVLPTSAEFQAENAIKQLQTPWPICAQVQHTAPTPKASKMPPFPTILVTDFGIHCYTIYTLHQVSCLRKNIGTGNFGTIIR